MTTQRDRLASVLHPLFECWHEEMHYIDDGKHVSAMYEPCKGKADFLLARGVRAVDGITLSRAVHEAVGSPFDKWFESSGYDLTSCRDIADAILAALDAER